MGDETTVRPGWANRRINRRDLLQVGAAGAGMLALAACGGSSAGAGNKNKKVTLNALFMQQASYSTSDVQHMTKLFHKANPNTHVNLTFVAYEALHDKIVSAAPAGTYDVVLIDVIWPAEFATKHIVKDITDKLPASERSQIFPGALDAAVYKGRYYGIPWILDTEYFFFNKKMLQQAGISQPPRTWDDVVTAAKAMKSKGIVKYPFIWKAAQEEEVVCDYGALLGAYGGTWFNGNKPTFNTGGGLQALEFMRMTMDQGLADPASLTATGDDCRKAVSEGRSAMCLNWTYMYALANDPSQSKVAGQIGIAHTPQGPAGAPGINGSMSLSVTTGCKNPDAALQYIQFLASKPVQDQYAQLSLPIWKSSYTQPKKLNAPAAVLAVARTQLNNMELRPQVPDYNAVSHILQVEIQNALAGRKTPKAALDSAASQAVSTMKNA